MVVRHRLVPLWPRRLLQFRDGIFGPPCATTPLLRPCASTRSMPLTWTPMGRRLRTLAAWDHRLTNGKTLSVVLRNAKLDGATVAIKKTCSAAVAREHWMEASEAMHRLVRSRRDATGDREQTLDVTPASLCRAMNDCLGGRGWRQSPSPALRWSPRRHFSSDLSDARSVATSAAWHLDGWSVPLVGTRNVWRLVQNGQ